MSTINRNCSKELLSKLLSIEKNINILEKYIFLKSNNDVDIYNNILYEIYYDLHEGIPLQSILDKLKQGKIYWGNESFDSVKFNQEEQDNYIINPFEAVEGVVTCKCGSNRTISFSKQIRSCDEGSSVIANCIDCKNTWTIGG